MRTIRQTIEAYRRALEVQDASAVAAFYDPPLAVIRPDRTVWIEDRETLRTEIGKILDVYRWAGMARVKLGHFEEVGFMEGLGIVNASWHVLDRADALVVAVDTTFLMRARDGRHAIAGVIAHNEETRRMPLAFGRTG